MSQKRFAAGALAGVFLLTQTACGTLLHPERKGQANTGKLDPTIVILDGIGLFFFLIPGVIAFVLDISNNTIYLPAGGGAGAGDAERAGAGGGWRAVTIDGPVDAAAIDAVIRRELAVSGVTGHESLRVRPASDAEARALQPFRKL